MIPVLENLTVRHDVFAKQRGFTFLELLIVLWVIGLLAAIAVPAYTNYVARSQVAEGMLLAMPVKEAIQTYYAHRGEFPVHNRAAGVADSEQLFGQYVQSIVVTNGAIHVTYRDNKILNGQVLSLHPAVNKGSEQITRWVCGAQSLDTEQWQVVGTDASTLPENHLPNTCRW